MTTDQRIVTAMAELMRQQGYAATGIQQLARAAHAPTGSIYHHFPGGKQEVAARALRESGAVYIQLLPALLDPHDSLGEGLRAAFAEAAETLQSTGWANMCPVGTVAGEVADAVPALRETAADVVNGWLAVGSEYLQGRGLSDVDARDLIWAVLSGLEGAFILARTLRSTEPLLAAGRSLAAYAATLPVAVARS